MSWGPAPGGPTQQASTKYPEPHRHSVPVSREGVQMLAALGLPNKNEFASVTRGLWE